MDDDASSQLDRWLNDPDHPERSQGKLGKILGVSQAAVSSWVRRKTIPEEFLWEPIELLTGVSRTAWCSADELLRRERVLAAVERELSPPIAEAS